MKWVFSYFVFKLVKHSTQKKKKKATFSFGPNVREFNSLALKGVSQGREEGHKSGWEKKRMCLESKRNGLVCTIGGDESATPRGRVETELVSDGVTGV